jgi:outer membrane translocation and assembly module TamA
MKVHTATAGVLCLASLSTGACVTRSTYAVAVADLEATKAELDRTSIQSQALTEQVTQLQQLKIDLASQMEATASAYRLATQQMEAERVAWQRLNKLSRMVSQLAAQQKSLLVALQRENKAQPGLQAMVEKYKAKLDEAGGLGVPLSTPPVERTNQLAETALTPPAQVAAQTDPAPKPTVTTPQPANKQTSEPVEEDWLSMLKEWIISIWRSIFSPAG